MAERSFKSEVADLRKGAGDTFTGEGILAITKALLENGVGYVGGYQGAPISHLMDVLADAEDLLADLGVRYTANASEAAAGAMLAASVHYPIRGAITFKGPVGVNVASDALANLCSSGVTGGALIIVGEDYGEGSSIMQERSHAFAMKSQFWLLDPRPNLPSIVKAVGDGFELSEASNTPVMLMVRIRACHVTGQFATRDNRRPALTVAEALDAPRREVGRIVLPPMSYAQEHDKISNRWPAALRFIREAGLNEVFGPPDAPVGIICQGGMYNGVIRALQRLGLADLSGGTQVPILCLNVTYPLVPDQVLDFCAGKSAVLTVEEGQPEFIEQALATTLLRAGSTTRLHGKDIFPMAGEYTGQVMLDSVDAFLRQCAPQMLPAQVRAPNEPAPAIPDLSKTVPVRPPGFCTGCPERPIFAAMKLVQRELGEHQISADIGCHLFASLPPFNIGGATMGYGLGPASNAAFDGGRQGGSGKRGIAIIGDGGLWHNGLTSSFGNMAFNKSDGVAVVVDNYYSAATGGQDVPSSRAANPTKATNNPISKALRGIGIDWVRQVDRTYDVAHMRDVLREALTTDAPGPKVIVASSECMLNKQRREKPLRAKAIREGRRVEAPRFGVDEAVCTGDHACIRLSGCPSLSLKKLDDPLRDDPVAAIDQTCVGCGNCGEVAEAAILCPSFYEARVIHNPTPWERRLTRWRGAVIGWLTRVQAADSPATGWDLTRQGAKYIANAMAYDDVIRVADEKTQAARLTRIRAEMGGAEVMELTDYTHPRGEEIVSLLPARLGRWIQARPRLLAWIDARVNRGRRLRTDRLGPYLQLWLIAGLRRWRRGSLRHAQEMAHLADWLDRALARAATDPAQAAELLKARRLVKGYSDTHARGLSKFDRVMAGADLVAGRPDAADWTRRLIAAALADEEGRALDGALATIRSFQAAPSPSGS